jgi:acyl dehydratase
MTSSTQLTVGEEIFSLSQEITREGIKAYADASGDQNPIHQVDEVALAVGLPGIIAHGMLSFGLISRATTDWLGDATRLRRLGVRFSTMVRPGDVVTCKGTVASVDEAADTAVLSVWVENQRGERVLSHGEAEIVL